MEHTKIKTAETTDCKTYSIPVIHNRIKNNQVTSLHLMVSLLLVILGFTTWITPPKINTINNELISNIGLLYLILGITLITICIFWNKKVIQSSGNLIIRFFEILLLLSIIIYTIIQEWYLPLAYSGAAFIGITFAFFWEKSAGNNFEIKVTPEGITLPRFGINKQILWRNIQQVIFKHGIITVDCRNNKIFQFQIKSAIFPDTKNMESFCTDKIAENAHLYQEDW